MTSPLRRCQHITGHVPRYPEAPDFCGKPVEADKPYCADHAAVCYRKALAKEDRLIGKSKVKKAAFHPSR